MVLKKTLIFTGVLALYTSCGKNSDKDTTEEESSTEAAEDNNAPPVTGALALLSPSEMMGFASDAVSSARQSNAFGESNTSSLKLLEESTSADPYNSNCNTNAQAFDPVKKQRLDENTSEYARAQTSCVLDAPSSGESITGKISMVKGVVCAFEKAIGGNIEYTVAGKEYKKTAVTIDTSCFSKEFVEKQKTEGGTSLEIDFKALDISATSNYEKELQFNVGDDISLKFIATEDLFAFHMGENLNNEDKMSASAVSVDRRAGVLRYETIDRRWGNHTRLLATGDFKDNSFSEFDSLEMIWQRFGFPTGGGDDNTPNQTDIINAPIITVNGNRNDGFKYRTDNYKCGFDDTTPACTDVYKGGVFSAQASICVDGAESCTGNDGIALSADNFDFLSVSSHFDDGNDAATIAKVKDWIKNSDVLCFDTVEPTLLPNSKCEASNASGLSLASASKKFYFKNTAHENPRISGWAEECNGKSSTINSIYEINAANIPSSSVSSIGSGNVHTLAFNVQTARGIFWGDYDMTAKVLVNDVEVATKNIKTADASNNSHPVEIPFDLGTFDSSSTVKVHLTGTLTCKTESTAKKPKAFSINLSTPVMRLLYTE